MSPRLLLAPPTDEMFTPNPVIASLTLTGLDQGTKVQEVRMVSLATGEQVYYAKELKAEDTIDTNSLKQGYYVLFYLINGEVAQQKVIKQ